MTGIAWQTVTCSSCGRSYQCTPSDDYYNATTTTDGVCFDCLTGGIPRTVTGRVVNGEVVIDDD